MSFIECNCHQDGSVDGNCDKAGKCSCKPDFDGDKCNTCAKGYFGEKCETHLATVLIPIMIIIFIFAFFAYRRYCFQLIICLLLLSLTYTISLTSMVVFCGVEFLRKISKTQNTNLNFNMKYMALLVMEFQDQGYKIRKIFA